MCRLPGSIIEAPSLAVVKDRVAVTSSAPQSDPVQTLLRVINKHFFQIFLLCPFLTDWFYWLSWIHTWMRVLRVTCEQANLGDKVASGSTSVSCCCVLFLSSPVETADYPSQRSCSPRTRCWKRDAELMRLLLSPWAIVWLQLHTNCERLCAHPTYTPSAASPSFFHPPHPQCFNNHVPGAYCPGECDWNTGCYGNPPAGDQTHLMMLAHRFSVLFSFADT